MLAVEGETRQMANWIGALIGLLGLLFAIYERQQRAKVEAVVRDILRRLAGEVRVVYSNANWADTHLRFIGHMFAEAEPNLSDIRKRAHDGARDAAACARQLALAHSQIKAIQQSLFRDSQEILPEIEADDVRAARSQSLIGDRAAGGQPAPPKKAL